METSTINQLIETSGILMSVIIAILFYLKVTNWRSAVNKEILLLRDCFFYRQIIEKYKDKIKETQDSSQINTLRKEVKEETGIVPSRYSEPGEILSRLSILKVKDHKLELLLSKIKF